MKIYNIFEGAMLIFFGISWPVAILKTIRAKNPAGKSILFLVFVVIGYICGFIGKMLRPEAFDWVGVLYVLNGVMVSTDLFLVLYYLNRNKKQKEIA